MSRRRFAWIAAGFASVVAVPSALAQGLVLPSGGPMHTSMGGTSSAVGVDAIGALYWNPAVIGGLKQSEVTLGSSLLIPHTGVTGTLPGGRFGPAMSGRTNSDSGVIPTTSIGIVYKPDESRLTYGLLLNTIGAGGVNFPGDANNPILAPRGPLNQFILGPQAAALTVLQIAPTAAYQVNDCLTVGFSPMIDVSAVSFDPAFFGPASQAGPDQPQQFPTGSHTRPFWGGGFRGGVTYRPVEHVALGFSYTSPQWFETWEFNARDANGNAITFDTQFTLPQIFSTGVAYDGIERLLLAADLRWFDYSTTKLLGQSIRDGGAGWNSVWAVSLGGKYQVNDRLSVQAGYVYNDNPVPGDLALFNTLLPAITQHTFSFGAAFQLNETVGVSLAYSHGFENTVGGGGTFPLAGASAVLDSKYDAIVAGLSIKFGGPKCKEACGCAAPACPCATPPADVPLPSAPLPSAPRQDTLPAVPAELPK